MYRELALVYDSPRAIEEALAAARITRDLAARLEIAPGRLLDLACGTGTLALEMAAAGWQVTGLDVSPAMIARAEHKCAVLGDLAPRFLTADMREVIPAGPFEVISCWGEGINHLPDPADLGQVFEAVRRAIAPGGLFVFDSLTEDACRSLWDGRSVLIDTPDSFVATQLRYDPESRRGLAKSTIFLREDDRYLRYQDQVEERFFDRDEIASALRAAGFHDVTREGFSPRAARDEGDPPDLWVARPG